MRKILFIIIGVLLLCNVAFAELDWYSKIQYDMYKDKPVLMAGEKDGVRAKLISGIGEVIFIENAGNFPIRFNYATDEYYYISKDGKYYLVSATAGNPPYCSGGRLVMNPDDMTIVTIGKENPVIQPKVISGEITKFLIIINGGKTKIELHPIIKK